MQAGEASLLPRKELTRYANIYALFAEFREGQSAEVRAWADLRVLEQRPALTQVSDWQLRSSLHQARTARWLMEVASSLAIQEAGKLGIQPKPVRPWPLHSACLPFHTSRPEALAKVVACRLGGGVYVEP